MVRGGGAGVARGGGTVMLAVGGLLVSVCTGGVSDNQWTD